jgi:hypothetical protein
MSVSKRAGSRRSLAFERPRFLLTSSANLGPSPIRYFRPLSAEVEKTKNAPVQRTRLPRIIHVTGNTDEVVVDTEPKAARG